MDRMKTSGSEAYSCIRTRSPRSAPPVIGDDGSTATTATARPALRTSPISAETSVDLPAPGGPVIPTTCAPPASGYSSRRAGSATAVRFSTAVRSRARARRSPALAAATRLAARAAASAESVSRDTLVARPGVGSQVLGHFGDRRARPEHPGDAGLGQGGDVVVGDDPAGCHEDVVEACVEEQLRDPGQERHVGARQDRQADDVDILLEGRRRDHLRRLAEAGVDDLEALVTEAPSENLGTAVVAVEARLGDEDLDRAVGHGPIVPRARGRTEPVAGNEPAPGTADRRVAPSAEIARNATTTPAPVRRRRRANVGRWRWPVRRPPDIGR